MPSTYVPVPDTIQAAVRFQLSGIQAEWVLNFSWPTAITVPIMQNLGKLIVDWVIGSIKPIANTDLVVNDVYLTDLSSNIAPAFSWTTGTSSNLPATGNIATVAVQNPTSLVVSKRTANRGRSFRGRTYFAGGSESQLGSNITWSNAGLTAWLGAYAALVAAISGAGFTDVVVSRFHNGAPRVTGLATPVIAYAADQLIATQRRRTK